MKIFLILTLNLIFASSTVANSLADRIKNDLKEECTKLIEWGQIKSENSPENIFQQDQYFHIGPNAFKPILRSGNFYLVEVFQEKLSCLSKSTSENSSVIQRCMDEFCPIKLLSPNGSIYVVGKKLKVSYEDQKLLVKFEVPPLYCQNSFSPTVKCYQNIELEKKENGDRKLIFSGYSSIEKELSISERPKTRPAVRETQFTLNMSQ